MKNELIKFAPLFAGLTDSERELLAAAFIEGQSSANSALLKYGERSDAMYLIGQGFVSLTTHSGTNLATLGPGSLIGDAALFRNTPQDINAVALSDLHYWQLTDRRLRDIILQQPSIGLKLGRNFGSQLAQMQDYLAQRLSKVPELAGMPTHTVQIIASRLQPREIKAKEAVYRAGDPPSGLFLVESGAIELRSEIEANGEKIEHLSPGSLFGGLALLTGKPNAQTAVATQDSMLWVLTADDFMAISHQHPGLRRILARTTRVRLSKADQSQVVLRLAQMPLFAEATPPVLQAVAQRMVLQHAPAGERVYMMGDASDALYFIESGEVELTAENASGVVEELARVESGGYFGDVGLLTGQVRTEDATAIRNTNLWILYKSDLDALAAQYPEIGKVMSQDLAARLAAEQAGQGEERFRQFELLSELGPTELKQVVDHLRPMRYRAGEQIFRASGPADTLYLLERGQVRIQPLQGPGWILGGGEAFGERALLTNQPHNTSATAETDVDVWTLSKQDFDVLMNRYPTLAISMSRILSQRLAQSQSVSDYVDYEGYEAGGFEEEAEFGYDPSISPDVASNLPSRRRRAVAEMQMRQTQPPPHAAQPQGFGSWFASLSILQRIQLAVLIVLIIFVIFVVAPLSLLSLLQGTSVARGAEIGSTRSSLLNAINAVYAVGSYELATQDKALAEALAMADKAVPPTPTYTPGPTFTPIPTSTPLPTATPTPVPTSTPPPTAAPFVEQFIPQAQPTETAAPEVAAAAAPPRVWDPRLDRLGVRVEDAPAGPGQQYWRLIEARWADEKESGGKHHIYVEVLDENGNRVVGHPVTVWWGDGAYTSNIEDKEPPDYGFNYMMYAAGNAYNIKVEGLPSDIVYGAGMGDIERREWGIHTSIYLTFQKATK